MKKFPLILLGCIALTVGGGVYAAETASGAEGINYKLFDVNLLPQDDDDKLNIETQKVRPSISQSNEAVRVSSLVVTGLDGSDIDESDLNEQLEMLVGLAEGKPVAFAGLKGFARDVQTWLREQGYFLAVVDIPSQRIQSGKVELRATLGWLESVKLKIDPKAHISHSLIADYVSTLKKGQILRLKDVERVVYLLSDLRGIEVSSAILTGTKPGGVALQIIVDEGKLLAGSFSVDSYGSRYTGRARFSTSVDLNALMGQGDIFRLGVQASRNSDGGKAKLDFGRVLWMVPVGGYGTKIGFSYAKAKYKLGKEFESLDASGNSKSVGGFLLHPLLRSRNANVFVRLMTDRRRIVDEQLASGFHSVKRSTIHSLGLISDMRDDVLTGGISTLSLMFNFGSLELSGQEQARDQSSAGRQTNGKFRKASWALARQQNLYTDPEDSYNKFVLYGAWRGQWANKNLDSSEKISLGGVDAVRAYRLGESSIDEGSVLTLELRKSLTPNANFVVFYDYGKGKVFKSPGVFDAENNERTIHGSGLGVTGVEGSAGLNYRFMVTRQSKKPYDDNVNDPYRFDVSLSKTF